MVYLRKTVSVTKASVSQFSSYTLIIVHRDIGFPRLVAYYFEGAQSRAASNPTGIRSVPAIFPTDPSLSAPNTHTLR